LRYREIRDAVQRAFWVYVSLFEIPDTFHEHLKTTIPWLSDVKIISLILGSALESLLPHFCDLAVTQTAALHAIAERFLTPTDFDSDLRILAQMFTCNNAHAGGLAQLGFLFALSFCYLTATQNCTRCRAFEWIDHLRLFLLHSSMCRRQSCAIPLPPGRAGFDLAVVTFGRGGI
jgi:hypothetical protein